jgi:hypothetical protein
LPSHFMEVLDKLHHIKGWRPLAAALHRWRGTAAFGGEHLPLGDGWRMRCTHVAVGSAY